jgi:uncharacterized membrane protein YfcA
MNHLEFTAIVLAISVLAGFLGSLTGLGGAIVVTPVLALLLGVDLHHAMGAALISVIATSSGAAAAYVREGYSNLRVGMFLEIAATIGAVVGAHLTTVVPASALAIIFGAVLLYSAWYSLRQPSRGRSASSDPLAARLRLNGAFPDAGGAWSGMQSAA